MLLALAFSIAAGIWWYRYTATPEYSLSQLGKAVREKNYGKASQYVNEERIAEAISQSLTDVLVAKYTSKFQDDPLPFTETRIEWLHNMAPRFHDWTLIGVRNAIRLLLSGNGILTGATGFHQLDQHNFSGLHVLRSAVNGDTADVYIGGLPQPNPFDLTEIRVRMRAHTEHTHLADRRDSRRHSNFCEVFRCAAATDATSITNTESRRKKSGSFCVPVRPVIGAGRASALHPIPAFLDPSRFSRRQPTCSQSR